MSGVGTVEIEIETFTFRPQSTFGQRQKTWLHLLELERLAMFEVLSVLLLGYDHQITGFAV